MSVKDKIIRPIYYFVRRLVRLNIIKTLYFNFKMMPIGQAIRLPIYLYGKIRFHGLHGKVTISAPIERGMIKIGYRWHDLWPTSYLPTQLRIDGKLVFDGWAIISGGAAITVVGAILKLGNLCVIGGGTVIKALKNISIGDSTRITGDCTIMDCDMHFVKNIETGVIKNNMAPIAIGSNCWINSRSVISKGAVIPDFTVAARSSFINKDYSQFGKNLFLVGQPAKPLDIKVQRIMGTTEQHRIAEEFKKNNCSEIVVEPGLFVEGDDNMKSFKEYGL